MLYTWQRLDVTKHQGEVTETAKTSTWSPNDCRTTSLNYSTQYGVAKLESVEHKVAEPRGISSQVEEEQERKGVQGT
jgi:hypothetical protein